MPLAGNRRRQRCSAHIFAYQRQEPRSYDQHDARNHRQIDSVAEQNIAEQNPFCRPVHPRIQTCLLLMSQRILDSQIRLNSVAISAATMGSHLMNIADISSHI